MQIAFQQLAISFPYFEVPTKVSGQKQEKFQDKSKKPLKGRTSPSGASCCKFLSVTVSTQHRQKKCQFYCILLTALAYLYSAQFCWQIWPDPIASSS